MDVKYTDTVKRAQVEENEQWLKQIPQIPFIQFPQEWKVKIIPPFAGATVRFLVKKGEGHVSVYLDMNGRLGAVRTPYWEVYPYRDDVYRCDMNEVDELLNVIQQILEDE